MDIKRFWNERIDEEKFVWGKGPTICGTKLAELTDTEVKKVLDLGSSYGRDTIYLAEKGFEVTATDISRKALELCEKWSADEGLSKQIMIECKDFLENEFQDNYFDAVVSFNFLHLFLEEKRKEVIRQTARIVRPNGIIVFANFSTGETQFGKGRKYENNSFETKGKPIHFFEEAEMKDAFTALFDVLSIEEKQIFEEHGGSKHFHMEWLLVARKK